MKSVNLVIIEYSITNDGPKIKILQTNNDNNQIPRIRESCLKLELFRISILTKFIDTGKYLAQMGNVPDLPRNKKPAHLHFYPKTLKFRKQKSLAMSVQVEAQHFCSKSLVKTKVHIHTTEE